VREVGAVDGVFFARDMNTDMGYHVVDPADLDTVPDRPCELRRVSDAAGFSRMAVNRFRADPGEQLPLAYHYHDEQEELFYVVKGTLAVETPERTYEVPAGSFFAVEPKSPQRAYNPADADGRVTVVAVGAPAVTDVHAYEPDDEDGDES
jgi:mannose-6-phosphate isomerase-like protein (cupin superfamily)